MTDKGIARLTMELRRWSTRPTSLSARTARTRILAHLPHRPRRPSWRFVAGSAAIAASALALVLVIGSRDEPIVSGPEPAAEMPQRMIVHQLSSGTKLYIVMQPSGAGDES